MGLGQAGVVGVGEERTLFEMEPKPHEKIVIPSALSAAAAKIDVCSHTVELPWQPQPAQFQR